MLKYGYLRPTTIDEVCKMKAQHLTKAKLIAGGTDLMIQIRDKSKKLQSMEYVIDLSHIKGLDTISNDGEYVKIGAMVTHSSLATSEIIESQAPFLREAALTVGSPQIRNRGTIGGCICNASPAADPVPPLVALNAEVVVESIRGRSVIPLTSIYEMADVTNLEEDEIIVEIRFRVLPKNTKTSFVKLGRRKALAISRINIASAIALNEDGRITFARIAPGCIFGIPDRVVEAENVLLGNKPDETLICLAASKVSEEMIKRTGIRWSTEFKKPAVEALTRRAIRQALEVK